MNFVPQVLIVANAWAAGFKPQGVALHHKPPREIQDKYDALRDLLTGEKLEALKRIEQDLVYLQGALADIMLGSESATGIAAQALLNEIDHVEVRAITWEKRIESY